MKEIKQVLLNCALTEFEIKHLDLCGFLISPYIQGIKIYFKSELNQDDLNSLFMELNSPFGIVRAEKENRYYLYIATFDTFYKFVNMLSNNKNFVQAIELNKIYAMIEIMSKEIKTSISSEVLK